MGIDASIYGNLGRGVRSVADYDNERATNELNALRLMTAKSDYAQGQQAIQSENALRAMSLTGDESADYAAMRRISPKAADTYRKAQLDAKKVQGDIGETQAKTDARKLESSIKAHDFHVQLLGSLTGPQDIPAWVDAGVQSGVFTPEQAQAGMQRAQQAISQPGGFDAWRQSALRGGMSATEQLKQQLAETAQKETGRSNVARETQTATRDAETGRHNRVGESLTARGQDKVDARSRESTAATMSKPFEVTGPDGNPVLVQQSKDGTITPVDGYAPKGGTGKPLPASVVKQVTEARDNSATITRLTDAFKPDFGGKGIFGLGADQAMSAKAAVGADADAVDWWKNYRKQAELVERHALFGASLTPGEQESWRSADISPGMNPKVIERNLKTRSALAAKVAENTAADAIDAGHSSERINKIASRNAQPDTKTQPKTVSFGDLK